MAQNNSLESANKRQSELVSIIKGSEDIRGQRPLFHFSTPGGWCNDPNGFSQYKGQIHLFYQYHPYSAKWGPMHWGHATSKDMLSWKIENVALAPDSDFDCKGCFSGTALEDGDKHILAYTGVFSNGMIDIQSQCIAIGDGKKYSKLQINPVVTAKDIPFEYNIEHFRDPKIWKKDDSYYMACVLMQKDNCGAIVLFMSHDIKSWTYKGVIDYSKDNLSKMWECPDITNIDGKDIIIFSPQEMKENHELGFHDGNNSVYASGFLDLQNCFFKREIRKENGYTASQIDYGIDFYAPETTRLKDGRTIMIGWMQSWESYITPQDYIWSGMMTIPRELSFKNGILHQLPVRELDNWKTKAITSEIGCRITETIFKLKERHFDFLLSLNNATEGTINIVLDSPKEEKVSLEVNISENYICFDRSHTCCKGNISSRKSRLLGIEKIHAIRILCDTCSIEVFINDGMYAFTNAFHFSDSKSNFFVSNNTKEKITYKYWKLTKP